MTDRNKMDVAVCSKSTLWPARPKKALPKPTEDPIARDRAIAKARHCAALAGESAFAAWVRSGAPIA